MESEADLEEAERLELRANYLFVLELDTMTPPFHSEDPVSRMKDVQLRAMAKRAEIITKTMMVILKELRVHQELMHEMDLKAVKFPEPSIKLNQEQQKVYSMILERWEKSS